MLVNMTPQLHVPFTKEHELFSSLNYSTFGNKNEKLPGHPSRPLDSTGALVRFLLGDLGTPELDKIAPHLWMMTTYSSRNIHLLHYQQVRGREIILCEFPRLHLTWKHSQVFIKPLPKYLLSYSFWERFLIEGSSSLGKDRKQIHKAALGLLRTYFHLIKHESDFDMAQSTRLLPQDITWEEFSYFIAGAESIRDSEVSPRYNYGEIRLTRLNFYAIFFLGRSRYEWGRPQYSTYFNQFYGHILVIFALFSLLLNAMQVELAAESLVGNQWPSMWHLSRYSSIICLVLFILITLYFAGSLIIMIAREWIYAIRGVEQKRRNKVSAPA